MSKRGRAEKRTDDRIAPTPETLAHWIANPDPMLQVLGYPAEPALEAAWKGIERAVALIAPEHHLQAADYASDRIRGRSEDWSPGAINLVHRYGVWAAGMRIQRMHIGAVIGVIACGDHPKWNKGMILQALRLYVRLNRRARA